ncbi:unnamed protein product [Trichobilharzia regenti]|nr:unnamed protein product [Trichobilharzia regenti]
MGINISRSKRNVHYNNPVLTTHSLIRQTKHVNCREDSRINPFDIIINDNNNQVELNRFFTEGDHTTYDISDNNDADGNEFLQSNLHESEIYKMLQQDTPCPIVKNNFIPSDRTSVVLQKYHHDDGDDNNNSQRLLNMQNEDNHCLHRFKFTSPSFLSIQRKKAQIKAINQRPAWKPALKVNYTKTTNDDYNDEVSRKFKQLRQNNFQSTICYNRMETPSSICSMIGDNSYYSLNNTAHIRRCTTAQLIKIDEGIRELESIKGSRSMKPNSRHLFTKSKSKRHNEQDIIEMENFKNEIRTQSSSGSHSSYPSDQIKLTRNIGRLLKN